jgi:hypothetical protein
MVATYGPSGVNRLTQNKKDGLMPQLNKKPKSFNGVNI